MSTIDLSQLRLLGVFATVIEVGSFAGAARHLNSSRSRVSEQVSKLESQLGVRLIQRSTRQLNITQEGKMVYQQARQLPDILQGVEAAIRPGTPAGRVAITMNHDIAHKYLLPVLGAFQQRYPQVQLDIMLSDDKLDYIQDQIDLGIRIGIPRDDSLIARVLHEESLNIYASSDYLKQHEAPTSISQLESHRWISLTQMRQLDLQLVNQQGGTVQVTPKQYYGCNSPHMLQQMVKAGLGIGLMLPTTVRSEIKQGLLLNIMPELATEKVVFSLVYPSRRQVPERTRVLIDYLLNANIFS